MWGSIVIFRSQRVYEQKTLENTGLRNLLRFSRIYQSSLLSQSSSCVLCIWLRCLYSCFRAAVFMHMLANVMPLRYRRLCEEHFTSVFRVKKNIIRPWSSRKHFFRQYICTKVYVSTSQKKCGPMISCKINSGQRRQFAWRKTCKYSFRTRGGRGISGGTRYVMKVPYFLTFVLVIVFFGRR